MRVVIFRRKLTLLIAMFLGRVLTQSNPKLAQPIRNFIGGCIFLVLLLVGSIPLALFAVLTMRTENKITEEAEENEDISSIL